jgi:hypothetical protein
MTHTDLPAGSFEHKVLMIAGKVNTLQNGGKHAFPNGMFFLPFGRT